MNWITIVVPLGFICAGFYFYYLSEKLSKEDDPGEDDEILGSNHEAVRAAGVVFSVIGFIILGVWAWTHFSRR